MAADLTGIQNQGEFFSQHYLDEILEKDLKEQLKVDGEGGATADSPRAVAERLRRLAPDYFKVLAHVGEVTAGAPEATRSFSTVERLLELSRPFQIRVAEALGYGYQSGATFPLGDATIPVLHEVQQGGAPYALVLAGHFVPGSESLLDVPFDGRLPPSAGKDQKHVPHGTTIGDVIQGLFAEEVPPRWVLLLSGKDIILAERARWGKGQYLRFDLGELLARRDPTALGITAVLLGRGTLAPEAGSPIHDTLDENSHKHAHGVSSELKHAARQAVELIGNGYVEWERTRGKQALYTDDAARALTEECLIYLYRLLFLFYAEARAGELRSLPMQSEEYALGYSLEMLREVEQVPLTTTEAQEGTFFDQTLKRIFSLVNGGHNPGQGELAPHAERAEKDYLDRGFTLSGLQSPLFDPASTPRLSRATLKNSTLQEVIRLLSLSPEGRRGRGKRAYGRGRISYAQLGINQLGSVYEGLLSYTGFFSKEDLFEVHKAGERTSDKTQQAYFVPAKDLARYSEKELTFEEPDGTRHKRKYERGTFIFRLAGRDRESSASYYTPEVLTRCLVKYSLKELLQSKTADDILKLTVCEPAMGSGAFLVEAVSQLSDAYLERKQAERGERIPPDQYGLEKQKVNTFIAAHNCYGVDLNPMAARLAGVSLWLATMHEGQKTPWFGGRLAVGNSLVGARLEVWEAKDLETDEPLAKALAPVLKKYGGAPSFEERVEDVLRLAEKSAPDAVAAVRKLFEEERRLLAAGDDETAEEGEGEEGGATDASPARASLSPEERTQAAREQTQKALKKLLAAFKLPRHHRKPPTALSASDVVAGKRPPGSVYHFLLFDEGMSPFDGDKAIKELAPQEVELLKKWRRGLTDGYDKHDIALLGRLSDRVDELYRQWARQRADLMHACRSEAPVWGQAAATKPAGGYQPLARREAMLATLKQPGKAYALLREAMDAWVALWGFPLESAAALPPRARFWKLLGEVLGADGALPEEVDLNQLAQTQLDLLGGKAPSSRPPKELPVPDAPLELRTVLHEAARRLTPHHWELEFAEVFTRPEKDGGGGFDLTVGNPPWIRLDWEEQDLLTELDPRLALDALGSAEVAKIRAHILSESEHEALYLKSYQQVLALQLYLASGSLYPNLAGSRTNLYKNFLALSWRVSSTDAVIGLIHQDGIFKEPGARLLRQALYPRLRWLFRFRNELKLFPEVDNARPYCLTVTGTAKLSNVQFTTIGNLFHPSTIEQSRAHDGGGEVPGLKDRTNHFEVRGHRSRIISVSIDELRLFNELLEVATIPIAQTQLPVVHSRQELDVLYRLRPRITPLGSLGVAVKGTKFWNETEQRDDGTIVRQVHEPTTTADWIVGGSHIGMMNPFFRNPRAVCTKASEYDVVDLNEIPESYLPRSVYRRGSTVRSVPKLSGRPVTDFYRHAHQEQAFLNTARSVTPCVLPPGAPHIYTVITFAYLDERLMLATNALWASLVVDFFARASGTGHLSVGVAKGLPIANAKSDTFPLLLERCVRLNCLTRDYAPLWDRHSSEFSSLPGRTPQYRPSWPCQEKWSVGAPLRTEADRRWALVEIDALAALHFGLSVQQLVSLYETRFPVFKEYEEDTYYDTNGRIAFTSSKALSAVGIQKRKDFEAWWAHLLAATTPEARALATRGKAFTDAAGNRHPALLDALQSEISERRLAGFTDPARPPFDVRDREADMRHAYAFFARELNIEVPV